MRDKLHKRVASLEAALPEPVALDLDAPISRRVAYDLWRVSGQPGDTLEDFQTLTERDMLLGFVSVYGPEVLDDIERDHGPAVRAEIERTVETEGRGDAQST